MRHWQGFTLVELVLVMLVIGILSVAVMPKWYTTGTSVNYEARRLLSDIRYTQALSVATGQRYRWVKVSASTYQILNESGSPIVLPSGGTVLTLTSGVTIGTLTNLPSNLVAFNSQGTPYTTTTIPGTALAATAIIPLSAGSVTRSVQITPQTGYGVLA
jgi:MSHA pilin protein MshC